MAASNKPYYAILVFFLVVAAAGGGYAVGTKHASAAPTSGQVALNNSGASSSGGASGSARGGYGGGGGGFAGGAPGGGAGGGFVTGQVSAVNGDTVTIQGRDGTPTTVTVSSSTDISKTVSGSPSDIAVGQSLTVRGSQADDGSVDATSVQIRPATSSTGGSTNSL